MKTYKKLSDISELVGGYAFKSDNYVSDGIRVVRITNVQDGYFSDEHPCFYPVSITRELGKAMLQENDLLMSLTGNVGRVAFLPKSMLPAGLNQRVECIRVGDENLKKYLYYYFRSVSFINEAVRNSTGVAQLNLSTKWLGEHLIPVVSPNESASIVKNLETINLAIKKCEQELIYYDELNKSRFIEMFGNPDMASQNSNWTKVTDVCEIITGTTPSTSDAKCWDGDILWITPAEIADSAFYIYDTERKITEYGRKSKSLSIMPAGTVILSTRAPIGKVAIAGKPMTCNQGFKNFVCKQSLNPVYLYFLLKFNKDYLNSIGSGTTFTEVSKSKIECLNIFVPQILLQNEFASFVKRVDKLKFI